MKCFLCIAFLFTLSSSAQITFAAQPPDPVGAVQQQLTKLSRDATPVTYETNSSFVYCRISCRDIQERNYVYDSFREIPNAGISAKQNPPSVFIAIPRDPAAFARNQALARQQGIATQAREAQQAAMSQAQRDAEVPLAFRFSNSPQEFYGREIVFDGTFEGLEPMPGDWSHELGFAVTEKGRKISCLVFASMLTGDPITQYVPIAMGTAVKSLKVSDKVRVWGKLVSPSSEAGGGISHLRRATAFFVVRNIERI